MMEAHGSKYRKAFKQYDKDGNGTLDLEELNKVLEELGKNTDPKEVEKFFKKVDTDNSGHINLEEFMVMMEDIDNAWIGVQKKTFTRWANTVLSERMMKIEHSLEKDFGNGVKLHALVEILAGKKMRKVNSKPKMRFHKLENLNTVIAFLKQEGIPLVNIASEDIEEGNLKITLGLTWMLILRYQISGDVAEGSPKWALLEWVKKQIKPYNLGIDLKSFRVGWSDGKVLSALTDSLKPGVVDMNNLESDRWKCTENAMDIAESEFEIPKVMDAADIVENPEEHSIMTYVSYFRDYLENRAKRAAEEAERERLRKLASADAEFCIAYGPGIDENGRINESRNFTVETRNCFDDKLTASDPQANIQCIVADGPSNIEVVIVDNGDGTYSCTYSTSRPGQYTFQIKCREALIKDGERTVEITGSVAGMCVCEGPGVDGGEVDFASNEPANFILTCRDSDGNQVPHGGEEVTIEVTGPDGQKIEATYQDNDDGTYICSYDPAGPGNYNVDVLVEQAPVKGSTFTASLGCVPSKCVAYGPGLEGAATNNAADFVVETRNVNDEKLSKSDGSPVEVKCISGPETLDVSVSDNGDGIYPCIYTATQSGEYVFQIFVRGEPISDYEKTVSVVGPAPDKCFVTGPGVEGGDAREESATFVVTSVNAKGQPLANGGDPFQASVTDPSGAHSPVELVDNGDGTYTGSYSVPAPGVYTVAVELDGVNVADSPYSALMEAGNAAMCWADGDGLVRGKTGRPTIFLIHSVDKDGNAVSIGGDPFEISITTPVGDLNVITPLDNDNGTYNCMYVPELAGSYQIDIKLHGENIKGSPFHPEIKQAPDASKSWAEGKGFEKAYDNRVANFIIHARDINDQPVSGDDCEVKITPVDDSSGLSDIQATVSDNGDGTYAVSYAPDVAGEYVINATLDGKPISNVPKNIVVREGADSKNVDRGEFRFTIRAKNKYGELKTEGGDEFDVKIEGPNGVDVPVTTKDHGDGHYSATYKLVAPREDGDTDPQEFVVSVQLNEEDINGSPFKHFM